MSLLGKAVAVVGRILGSGKQEPSGQREFGGFEFEIPDSFDAPLPENELEPWEGAAPE